MKISNPYPDGITLSIIVPVYNEKDTVIDLLETVLATPHTKQVILVDDCSSDGTTDILGEFSHKDVEIHYHEMNQGKGAAIRTALSKVRGDIVLIQDADLEYDPDEYPVLLKPILDGRADVVYGSRFAGHGAHRVIYFWHMVGNRFLTLMSNLFTNLTLTDMETCYKVFRREVLDGIIIQQNRFGFEPEITAKVAKKKVRIYEVPISYYGRTYEEGKKIGWKDGVKAIYCILRYNLLS